MAIPLDPKQLVSFEKLLMSQVAQQEALTRLLIEKGIFTKEEFLEMVEVVNLEIKKMVQVIYCSPEMTRVIDVIDQPGIG
jgi:hypothetical protein